MSDNLFPESSFDNYQPEEEALMDFNESDKDTVCPHCGEKLVIRYESIEAWGRKEYYRMIVCSACE